MTIYNHCALRVTIGRRHGNVIIKSPIVMSDVTPMVIQHDVELFEKYRSGPAICEKIKQGGGERPKDLIR